MRTVTDPPALTGRFSAGPRIRLNEIAIPYVGEKKFMRLTLRTLLAYLDDILEPADAKELGKRIEESEFASGLVHRIRGVTRKLRLGAPKLSGKGMGLDANTVAEYLDNTLPRDRIPDFEKVCLESDVHLAEVASGHQILTLVLGEPADVDPALHERISSLRSRIGPVEGTAEERPARAAAATDVEAPPVAGHHRQHEQAAGDHVDESPEVPVISPSVVRPAAPQSKVPLLPVLATLVAAFLLASIGLFALGPLDSEHPILGRMFAASSADTPSKSDDSDTGSAALEKPDTGRTKAETGGADGGTQDAQAAAASAASVAGGAKTEVTQSESETAADASDAGSADARVFPEPPPDKPSTAATGPAQPAAKALSEDSVPSSTSPEETNRDRPAAGGIEPAAAKAKPVAAAEGTVGKPADEEEHDAAPPAPLARCTSSAHLLACFDPGAETWWRLTADDAVPPRRRLIALPVYRPRLTLGSGIQLTLVGPAAVSLQPPDTEGIPGVVVHYGRILMTGGSPEAKLIVQPGERAAEITFSNADSSLALDVQRYHQPGTNPEKNVAQWVVKAYPTAGQLTWQEAGSDEALLFEAGEVTSIIDAQPPRLTSEPSRPQWLNADNTRLIDRDASRRLEPLLKLDQPVGKSLREQVGSRLVEVRSLAIRSLCALGRYDSFVVDAFNSKEYHTFWPDLFSALQLSLAQDTQKAKEIHALLERLRGVEGRQLFRCLWGFSPDQLANDQAAALVDSLASPSMDIRVFAFENLYRIVGKTNSYQPELEPKRQERAIMNWQRDLRKNEIVYQTPPFDPSE